MTTNFKSILKLPFVLGICLIVSNQILADVIVDWNKELIRAVTVKGTHAPVASRAFAMLHIAMFDAINGIQPRYTSYLPMRPPGQTASEEAAATTAAHRVLTTLYADKTLVSSFERLHTTILAAIPPSIGKENGIRWGEIVATEILATRAHDGSANVKLPPKGSGAGAWLPTAPLRAPFDLQQWGFVMPFALKSRDQFRPPPPPKLTSDQWAREYNEVKAWGGAKSSMRTKDQTDRALFWANGEGTQSLPAHWNLIAARVAIARNNSLIGNARLFALLNIAMADAAIAAWDAKYTYNFWRPITAIQNGDSDLNGSTQKDAAWTPLITTPPFPDYISGHSTLSPAATSILAQFFGTDAIAFTSVAPLSPPISRAFSSFSDAAKESAESRLFAGIHFRSANEMGLIVGEKIGRWVFARFLRERN